MPRNVLILAGVAVAVAVILIAGLSVARTQEGRGVDAAVPETRPDPESRDFDVRITREGFEPKTLKVPVEQIVRWRNDSGEPLRIEVATDQRGDSRTQGLASAVIAPGASHAFSPPKGGMYRYRSSTDSGETGVIEAG